MVIKFGERIAYRLVMYPTSRTYQSDIVNYPVLKGEVSRVD
ncbi:hypothetical protein CCP3SC1_500022 [Gammaproteobacteria bacterium]